MLQRRPAMRALLLCLLSACAPADGEPKRIDRPIDHSTGRTGNDGPLVLELFTSQGCSSCPAAEQLLAKLARTGTVGDRAIAPLAFHVDYWNDLGWADPYSLPAWTERQNQYAQALGDNRVYTPELVVGGAAGMIGSSSGQIMEAIQRAPRPAKLAATATWSAATVTVNATAPAGAEVWVAVWEDRPPNAVARGENAGTTLLGDRVVRRFERVAAAGQAGSATIKLDPAWKAGGAVAFAHGADRKIVASALLSQPRS